MPNSNDNQIDLSHLPEETQTKLATFSLEDQRAFLVASGQMPIKKATDDAGDPPTGDPLDIPEKFQRDSLEDSFKDLLKSYKELEQKQSQKKPEGQTDPPKDLKIEKKEPTEEPPAPAKDLNSLFNEMLTKGEIPEEELKGAGFNEDTIDYFRNLMEQT